MKNLLTIIIVTAVIAGCSGETQKDKTENPWMGLAEKADLPSPQETRLAEVLKENFEEDDIPEIRKWQERGDMWDFGEIQKGMQELVPYAENMEEIPDNKLGEIIREFPLTKMCELLASTPEEARFIEDLSRKIIYLYCQENPEFKKELFKQWDSEVGRKLVFIYYENIKYISYGGER